MDGTSQDLGDDAIWLGVDLGTQGVRVLAADAHGRVLERAGVALSSDRDGDRHEQDPEAWWSAFVQAAGAVTRDVDADRIRGISACSTSGTVLFVADADGDPARPVTPALMYDDGRAGEYAERAAAAPAPGWAAAGARPQATWGLAKALWLLDRHDVPPGARLAHQADLVTSRLAGVPVATDWSHSLKSGVDLVRGDWPVDQLGRLGLAADRLPPVVPPGAPLGVVDTGAADLTGIPAGTPVVAGLTDGCAAQVASGALGAGAWNFVLGTTLVLKGTTTEPVQDPSGAVYSHRSPDGPWWPGGASSAGAGVLAREFAGADLAELDLAAAGHEPAGCLCYPLAGRGERFPFTRPDAEGFTVGSPQDDGDRYAALLQGVAFVERLCLDHLRELGAPVRGSVTLTGGATRSAYWSQLQADVLGREVVVPEVPDGAFGMAVVAASLAYDSLAAAAAAMVRTRSRLRTPAGGLGPDGSHVRPVGGRAGGTRMDRPAPAEGRPVGRLSGRPGRRPPRAPGRLTDAALTGHRPDACRPCRRRTGEWVRPRVIDGAGVRQWRRPPLDERTAVTDHPVTVFLVRHGETPMHAENRYVGRTDAPLTERGHAQAAALGDWAATARLTAIASSPLRRARETADPAARKSSLDLLVDERLVELDFGAADGLTAAEMRSRFPAERAAFEADPYAHPLPGGEQPSAAIVRGRAALDTLVCRDAPLRGSAEGRVLVVAHGTFLRLVICDLLGVPHSAYRTAFPVIRNATGAVLRRDRSGCWGLVAWNPPLVPDAETW